MTDDGWVRAVIRLIGRPGGMPEALRLVLANVPEKTDDPTLD